MKQKASGVKRTAGTWDPAAPHVYFAAGSFTWILEARHVAKNVLVAVNELKSGDRQEGLDTLLKNGNAVLVDSGVYSLAAATAEKRGITHDEALRMPIEKLDGFADLFKRYTAIAHTYQDKTWGMVEVDLGGRDQKRKTRKKLEDMGIRPIPVYHPLNDGWDYFDELAEQYDRICVGNIVNASSYVRLRLLSTIWERKQRRAPKLWIHALGLTPGPMLCAYPVNSADSSSWLSALRWNGFKEAACLKTLGDLPRHFQYVLGDRETMVKGALMGGIGVTLITRNWNLYLESMRRAGIYVDSGLVQNNLRRLSPMARRAA